jgi:hypothetical protein
VSFLLSSSLNVIPIISTPYRPLLLTVVHVSHFP